MPLTVSDNITLPENKSILTVIKNRIIIINNEWILILLVA